MLPVLTPSEMRAVVEAAREPVEVLIGRAGAAVAQAALRMLGGAYGRRVVVVAGKGNNGADGREAADRLRRRGARVEVIDAAADVERVPPCDLVIDAAYGTGFRGDYRAPHPGGAPVLAVDIPSGVDGLTGEAAPSAVRADTTVTFAALKPGLLFTDRAGVVEVVDIGLDASAARMHVVDDDDIVGALPTPPRETHKWRTAVGVVAGSRGMTGAAHLVARAAMRAGAGYVRLGVPGEVAGGTEAVAVPVAPGAWGAVFERCRAGVVGPGLGRNDDVRREVNGLLAATDVPMVVDADGLNVLDVEVVRGRSAPTVLTPHDQEYERLAGRPVGPDRVAAARELAATTGAVVLLKGSTTVVAAADGAVRFSLTGGPRLATAGTGDVLSGVVAAFLARGVPPLDAAALAAHVHGAAARRGRSWGLVAGDLPGLVSDWLSERCGG